MVEKRNARRVGVRECGLGRAVGAASRLCPASRERSPEHSSVSYGTSPISRAIPQPLAELHSLFIRTSDVTFGVRQIRIQRNAAFTLVELLVVVAIIGLLLAIILPTMAKAKEQSRRVVCQSNLHQFFIGLSVYASAYSQVLPSGRSDVSGDEHTPVLASKTRKELLKYVGHPKVLECPWLGGPFKSTGGWYYPGYGYVLGYNYLGGHKATPWTPPPGYTQWRSPQRTTDATTTPILAELNAWTTGEHRTWAPHGLRGPITQYGDQGKGGMTSKEAGAAGGNSCKMDGSISWKGISKMKYYQGSQMQPEGCRTMW